MMVAEKSQPGLPATPNGMGGMGGLDFCRPLTRSIPDDDERGVYGKAFAPSRRAR
jgi:hypothetical protein